MPDPTSRRRFLTFVGAGAVSIPAARYVLAGGDDDHFIEVPTLMCKGCGMIQCSLYERDADGVLRLTVEEYHAEGCPHA